MNQDAVATTNAVTATTTTLCTDSASIDENIWTKISLHKDLTPCFYSFYTEEKIAKGSEVTVEVKMAKGKGDVYFGPYHNVDEKYVETWSIDRHGKTSRDGVMPSTSPMYIGVHIRHAVADTACEIRYKVAPESINAKLDTKFKDTSTGRKFMTYTMRCIINDDCLCLKVSLLYSHILFTRFVHAHMTNRLFHCHHSSSP